MPGIPSLVSGVVGKAVTPALKPVTSKITDTVSGRFGKILDCVDNRDMI